MVVDTTLSEIAVSFTTYRRGSFNTIDYDDANLIENKFIDLNLKDCRAS